MLRMMTATATPTLVVGSTATMTPPELTSARSSTQSSTTAALDRPKCKGHIRIPWRLVDDFGHLIGAAGWVLVALMRFADRYGRCWPSIETLAKTAGMGQNTIRRHIRTLQELGLIRIEYGGLTTRTVGHSRTRSNLYQLAILKPDEGFQNDSLKGSSLEASRVPDWRRNQLQMNQNQQPTSKDDAVRANGKATSGGGESDSRLDANAEVIIRAMAAHGVTRAPHTEALATRIAAYPHALEVIEAEHSAISGKSRNEPGALYVRLNRMTADDWAARAPKARPVFRIKEAQE